MDGPQGLPADAIIRDRFPDQIPKGFGMIKLLQMAELVDDQVVLELWWEIHDAVVKIQIAFFGTAPPPGGLIFDTDFADRKAVSSVEVRYAVFHDPKRSWLVQRKRYPTH